MQCIDAIKKQTFGKKSKSFSLTSDYDSNLSMINLDIAYPIFAIHGNHDDRAGPKKVSALDVLHSAGILNLFGNQDNVSEDMDIKPLEFSKGKTKVSLYGIGSIKDDRLLHQFEEKRVLF